MTHPDADVRLAALFAADLPPARDMEFQAEVLAALARRRFQADLLLLLTVITVTAAGLWLIWPAFSPTVEALAHGLAPGLAAVIAAGSILALTTGWILAPRS